MEITNVTKPFHGATGVNNQTIPAIPTTALTTSRIALRIVFARDGCDGCAEPAKKLYPQSQRSASSGLINRQVGHSFVIEELVLEKTNYVREDELTPKVLTERLIS